MNIMYWILHIIFVLSSGQVERRSHNGTVEISFPDGSVRILESDGIEKWSLPDGTLIQILTNGEKILTLPNGQREVHTTTHKVTHSNNIKNIFSVYSKYRYLSNYFLCV